MNRKDMIQGESKTTTPHNIFQLNDMRQDEASAQNTIHHIHHLLVVSKEKLQDEPLWAEKFYKDAQRELREKPELLEKLPVEAQVLQSELAIQVNL